MLDGIRRAVALSLRKTAGAITPTRYAAGFSAARGDNFNGDWIFGAESINSILRTDLATLRDKSRSVAMNTAAGARIKTLYSENVSGKDGILYQPAIVTESGEPDEATNRTLEDGWYRWAEDHTAVSADRRMTWQEIEQFTDEAEATDGETLLRILPGFANSWRFAVQVLDPDQLDLGYNVESQSGRNAIVMGVEVDQWGAPVAYHLWPNHPSESRGLRRGDRLRVPAEQILHNYLVTRPGQVRGIPWYTPVLADLMHLAKYREAEVIAARTAAAKMGFIKGGTGESEQVELIPGSFPKLGDGEEVQFFDPNHPNGNYDAFDRAIMRSVASAFRVSYMSLSGDLSQTSFASGQMGYMSEKNMYRTLQERRILRYSRPVHRAWLSMAIVSGQLDVRGSLGDLLRADWRARPFHPIDPLKAANTDAINLALGKTCLTDLVEADGGDLRRVLQKRQKEMQLAESLGVPLYLPVGNAIQVTDSGETDASEDQSADSRASTAPALKRVA